MGGAVDVLLVVGMGMVLAVVGDPADGSALRGTAADRREDIFEPPRP